LFQTAVIVAKSNDSPPGFVLRLRALIDLSVSSDSPFVLAMAGSWFLADSTCSDYLQPQSRQSLPSQFMTHPSDRQKKKTPRIVHEPRLNQRARAHDRPTLKLHEKTQ